MSKTREEEITIRIEEKFMEKYPNVSKQFKEYIRPFISWIIERTIEEMKK